jgi:hypothetical protein
MNRGLVRSILTLLAVAICGCKDDNSFEAEFKKATAVIARRDTWPDSPEKVSAAFWEARSKKDYAEMHILWPGSASFDWPAICAKESDVKCVFGQAQMPTSVRSGELPEEVWVPYAWQEHFHKQGSYNFRMILQALNTPKGKRWYVVSGN